MKAKIKFGSFKGIVGYLKPFVVVNDRIVKYFFERKEFPPGFLVVNDSEVELL